MLLHNGEIKLFRIFLFGFIFLLCCTPPGIASFLLSEDQLGHFKEPYPYLDDWRYHSGDNPEWSFPDYNDQDWEQMNTTLLREENMPQSGWDGIGWFRTTIDLDSSLFGQRISIMHSQMGLLHVYIDGESVFDMTRQDSLHRVTCTYLNYPMNITLPEKSPFVLAVRYENPHWRQFHRAGNRAGFLLFFSDPQEAFQISRGETVRINSIQMFAVGALLAMALLHLLLFIFNPRTKGNLHYSIFIICTSFLTLTIFGDLYYINVPLYVLRLHIFRIALLAVLVSGLRFIYSISYERLPVQYWFFLTTAILFALLNAFIHVTILYAFVFAVMLELVLSMVRAVRNRMEGSWIVFLGVLVFAFTSGYEIVVDILNLHPTTFTYLYGMLALLLSMFIYLARSVGIMNLRLREQIKQIQALSDRTIQQERKARKQEISQKMLEAEIERKKIELNEERKLRKVLKELEETNKSLRDAQSQLVQSEKMASLGLLVAGIAHEINTPIGAVHSMRATLFSAVRKLKDHFESKYPEEFTDNKQVQSAVRVIDDANRVMESGTERVATIVRRLKSFARMDRSELTEANIHDGLEDTLLLVHHELKHGIQVNRDYGELPMIACYPGQLNQVFLNLIINAKQAMNGKGELSIQTRLVNNNIVMKISDTGVGIPAEHLEKIFDPGFTTKGVGVGTGLGLSICYRIIQDHHGTITAESEIGKGTTFTITLPVVHKHTSDLQPEE